MLFKNTASQKVRVFAFADAGHATLDPGEPVTGDAANISAQTALDNAALGASNDAAPTEVDATNAPGYYEFDPTQAETNGDIIEWYPKSSTAGVQVVTVGGASQMLVPANFPDLGIETDGDLTKVNTLDGHTAQTGDNFARLGAPAGASVSADIADVDTDVAALNDLSAAQVNAEVDTALSDIHLDHLLAADYDPASKPGTSTALLNELVENDSGVSRFTANALEEAPSGGGGSGLSAVTTGTAQAGAASTITLASGESATDDIFLGSRIVLTGGTGEKQARMVTDYNGTTKVLTVDRAWQTNPDATTTYEIQGAASPLSDGNGFGQLNYSGGIVNANVEKWNNNSVPAEDAQGHPIVTIRDGTGPGEINTASGAVVQVDQLGTQAKADVNAEVDSALDTAVPGSPTAGSINERVKTMDDADMPSSLVVIESDTAAIESAGGSLTAAQDSKLTQVHSDVIVVDAAVSDVESSLVIVKSDLVVIESDTTAIESAGGSLTTAQDSKLTEVHGDVNNIYSDTTVIESDTTAIESAGGSLTTAQDSKLTEIHTDVNNVYSDTTIIVSDTTTISSDTAALEAAVSDVESSLVVIKSDIVVIDGAVSDVESSLVVVKSDIVVLDNAVSDVESSLVVVKSDLVVVESDTTAIHSQTTVVESDTAVIESQTTVIESDTAVVESWGLGAVASDAAAIHSQTTVIESDVAVIESQTTVIKSDTAVIESDTTVIESQTTVIESDVALLETAHSEPTGVPAANETPLDKLGYVFMALRNKLDVTSTKKTFYDDGGSAEWEKDLSDDGTTYSESEGNAI